MNRHELISVLDRNCDFHYEETDKCYGCPLEDNGWCGEKFHEEVCRFLKDQEPRVLTLEEVCHGPVYYEPICASIELAYVYKVGSSFDIMTMGTSDIVSEKACNYGRRWRCWSDAPADEQRMEAKWDETK